MHVTSNPYFSFHDDVFPRFSKNAVSQLKFPASVYPKTIIPASPFSSLEELKHISTVVMRLNGTDKFQFAINTSAITGQETEILELKFFDRTSLFLFGFRANGSFWLKSDYFDDFTFQSHGSESTNLTFYFDSVSYHLEVFQEELYYKYYNKNQFNYIFVCVVSFLIICESFYLKTSLEFKGYGS